MMIAAKTDLMRLKVCMLESSEVKTLMYILPFFPFFPFFASSLVNLFYPCKLS